MVENPWAYNEARNRIREKQEREQVVVETMKEDFEKTKEKLRKTRKLDVFQLKNKIVTGHSLDSLKSEVSQALKEGVISRETYDRMIASLEKDESQKETTVVGRIDPQKLPFSQNALAKYFEEQRLGENIWADVVWFLYGFFVQGSAILVIIAWKILVDLLRLPVDIYNEVKKS